LENWRIGEHRYKVCERLSALNAQQQPPPVSLCPVSVITWLSATLRSLHSGSKDSSLCDGAALSSGQPAATAVVTHLASMSSSDVVAPRGFQLLQRWSPVRQMIPGNGRDCGGRLAKDAPVVVEAIRITMSLAASRNDALLSIRSWILHADANSICPSATRSRCSPLASTALNIIIDST
jgi:hypothetical protein